MLVNYDANNGNIKFISYTGRYPNLCRGVLTLEIDGEIVKFGDYDDKNSFDSFWISGGGISKDYVAYGGEWEIDVNDLPEQYKKYAAEIDEIFNSNVYFGCCGGCI